MAGSRKAPLTTSNAANILPDTTTAATGGTKKTIEQTYQKKTQLEHILLRPDTYIGSVEKHTQTQWVYQEDDTMVQKSITIVPGLYKIFDEILVNAADNKQRDPKMDAVKVSIDVEANAISVWNNGDGVPVEIHQEEGVYVPELIFGHLLTSSNYDDDEKKTTGGRNGYGAKLTNIFSTEFVIETADGKRQKKYKQVFSNNMGTKTEPVISKCKSGENWTKITFKPDLSKFGMTCLEPDVVALMKRRVIDVAGCLGKTVKVELNGQSFHFKTFSSYCDLYLKSPSVSTSEPLPRYEEEVHGRWQICISRSEGQFQQVSFVNGIATVKGGTHVDYVTGKITSHLINVLKTKNKKDKNFNLKPHAVKNHLWVFVNALIDNPAFDSQTKETLTLRAGSFGSSWDFSTKFLDKVAKSDIMKNIEEWADFKQKKDLKKTDGAKNRKIFGLPKLDDAGHAGGKESEKCTLILTEGDSAKALALAGISEVGRDKYGVFPLRGKLLNVREASHTQLMANAEIQHIKQILGLQQGKQYDSAKSLRYGHLMIMTDQDHDGSHIKGLLINFIHTFWPSLLKVPSFLVEFITPIVKATRKDGSSKMSFYTMPQYEEWKQSLGTDARKWSIKYYKGLGTSTAKEGKEYFKALDKHQKDFLWVDDQDSDAIELAFSKKKADARKSWLLQYEPGTYLDQREKLIKYRDFVHKELILFSRADVVRSIPSMVDGLKPGQRKILFCAFKRNFVKEAKVAQFSGYVSEHSAYHHGEQSLAGTIIGMAQTYVGSNNINFLEPNGQFGTRGQGGKDHASARYVFTQLSPITRFLFQKDDDILLDYLNEDGQSIEPTWYVPIIPTVLVNGSEGIGTGWSSFVPNYNPRDIIANVRRLLNGEEMVPMHPWYKGFRGTIEKTATKEVGNTYTVTGAIEEVDEKTLRITELPIRKWTQDYKEFLESVCVENEKSKDPFIEGCSDYSDGNIVHFLVYLTEENLNAAKQEGLLKKFKLTTTISTSNMHLFDTRGVIKKYETPEQIIEDFFPLRLEFYEKRKKAMLNNLEFDLLKCSNKVRFIKCVVDGSIIVSNRRRADLFVELKEKGFTPFPKKKTVEEVAVAGATDDTEETEENAGLATSHEVSAGDYDYLLSLSIGTLTIEKMRELLAEKDKLDQEVKDLQNATIMSLWLRDLDALEGKLDEIEGKDEKQFKKDMQAVKAKAKVVRVEVKPRKKATKKESAAEPMDVSGDTVTEADNVPEVKKAKGRAPAKKKVPAKKAAAAAAAKEDDDIGIASLRDRLANYNLNSSPDRTEDMDADVAPKQNKKKEPVKRAAAAKKKATITELSDDEDGIEVLSGDDSELEDKPKKGGRKPANTKAAAKPAAGAKKRGPASKKTAVPAGQTLITDALKPVENSPEKKVRKMRASPFNKKSSSILGRTISIDEEDESMAENNNSGASSLNSIAEVVPRARPVRANRGAAKYVVSDDSESGGDDDDSDAAIELSDEE